MRLRTSAPALWRVLEVIGIEGTAPSWSAFRLAPGGIDTEVVAHSGAEAIAAVRVDCAASRRVWLYVATCGRRPTKANPNGVLAGPKVEVDA